VQLVKTCLRPLITPNNAIAAYPSSNALVITDYAGQSPADRADHRIARQPPGSGACHRAGPYASALDIVALLNRLLTETPAGGRGVAADSQHG